jgi:hypothetical protein
MMPPTLIMAVAPCFCCSRWHPQTCTRLLLTTAPYLATNDDDALYFPKWPAGGMNEMKEKKQHQHDLMQDPRRFESIQRTASLYPFLSKPFEQSYWGA